MILGVIQARMSSSRLPGKVLAPVLGEPMLARQVERVLRANALDKLVVATSTDASDDPLTVVCQSTGVECFRGPLDDVLERIYGAATTFGADHVVRLTGDCPLADPGVIDDVVRLHLTGDYDYTSNVCPPTFPDGLDVEIATMATIAMAWRAADRTAQREHVTLWIRDNSERFRIGNLTHEPDLSGRRWTVDEPEDLAFVSRVYGELYPASPDFRMDDVLALLERLPELNDINQGVGRDEGLAKSFREDAPAPRDEG